MQNSVDTSALRGSDYWTYVYRDHPKYYPPFGEEEARNLLKEKSINQQDTPFDSTDNIHEEHSPIFSDTQIQECENLADRLLLFLSK